MLAGRVSRGWRSQVVGCSSSENSERLYECGARQKVPPPKYLEPVVVQKDLLTIVDALDLSAVLRRGLSDE